MWWIINYFESMHVEFDLCLKFPYYKYNKYFWELWLFFSLPPIRADDHVPSCTDQSPPRWNERVRGSVCSTQVHESLSDMTPLRFQPLSIVAVFCCVARWWSRRRKRLYGSTTIRYSSIQDSSQRLLSNIFKCLMWVFFLTGLLEVGSCLCAGGSAVCLRAAAGKERWHVKKRQRRQTRRLFLCVQLRAVVQDVDDALRLLRSQVSLTSRSPSSIHAPSLLDLHIYLCTWLC